MKHSIVSMNRRRANGALAILAAVALTAVAPATGFTQPRTLSLTEYLALVEEGSLQLEISRTDRVLAEAGERVARSGLLPSVGGEVGYTRNFIDIETGQAAFADTNTDLGSGLIPVISQPRVVSDDNEYSAGVSLSQVFDLATVRSFDASRQLTDLTYTVHEATRHRVLTTAKQLFFQTLLLQEVLLVRRASEEAALNNFLDTQNRLENGLATQLDVLTAEVDWQITRPDTTQAERDLAVAQQSVRTFAGLPQHGDLVITGSLGEYPPPPSFDGAFDERINRPDYRALLGERRLREIEIGVRQAAFYPSLSASLTYGWEAGDDGFDLTADDSDFFAAGFTVTIPLFLGGARFARLERARLELVQNASEIALTDENIATEIETIRLTLEEASVRIESAEQTRETAERAYAVTQTSVANGLSTQLELQSARVHRDQARLNYLTAVFDYLIAYFDWQLATGRGDQTL